MLTGQAAFCLIMNNENKRLLIALLLESRKNKYEVDVILFKNDHC